MHDLCALRSLITDLQKAEEDFSRRLGLSLAQASMLCAVSHGYHELKELQEQLALTPSRVTRLTESLVTKGLIKRDERGTDRRFVTVSLTDEGEKLTRENGDCALSLPEDIENLLKERAKERTWERHM